MVRTIYHVTGIKPAAALKTDQISTVPAAILLAIFTRGRDCRLIMSTVRSMDVLIISSANAPLQQIRSAIHSTAANAKYYLGRDNHRIHLKHDAQALLCAHRLCDLLDG